MHQIYSVDVKLATQVHCQALGLTSVVSLFVYASGPAEAERIAQAVCIGRGAQFKECRQVRVALNQLVARYTFVEQIYGLPVAMGVGAIQAQGLGPTITAGSIKDLESNARMVEAALAQLGQSAGEVAA